MPAASAPLIVVITLTFFLAGIVKGVAGMGLPTIAVLASRLWPMMLGIVVGTVAGSRLLLLRSQLCPL